MEHNQPNAGTSSQQIQADDNGQTMEQIPPSNPPAPHMKTGFSAIPGSATAERGDSGFMKHSGWGIASVVLFILTLIITIYSISTIFAAVEPYITEDRFLDPVQYQQELAGNPSFILASFLFLLSGLGYLLGLIFGIVGLVQKMRHKIFPVIGTILNGIIVGLFLLMVMLIIGAGALAG